MDDNTPAYGFERDDISLLMQTSTTFFKAFHNSQESEQSKRGHRCSGGPIAALLCTLLSEIVILWAVTCWFLVEKIRSGWIYVQSGNLILHPCYRSCHSCNAITPNHAT
ncbi:uncharacterized protein [Physcomitrium patens]|uniref:uncharacterized protein isoform X2 n=1 Tax=Physcomitrium patens TaxID=3218 RepID=UPI000D1658B7|nr:uncharacterized protein LOC112293177 [Physcomitrium patens]|eukprot:XP_024398107.1 uncharacterized protein LOC112293177 [Physcomitrella patens]